VLVRNAEAAGTRVLSIARLHAARAAKQTLEKTMKMRIAILASCAVAAVFIAGGVHAETLKPIQGRSIDLGTLAGIAYYTVEPEGYRLVATLGSDTPVHFVATLAPGQSVTLSTPRVLGQLAAEVRFMRRGDELFVNDGAKLPERVTH
jgi:hypothetical protein